MSRLVAVAARLSARRSAFLVSAALASLAACGGSAETTKEPAKTAEAASSDDVEAKQIEVDGNTVIERFDINGDKKADVFKYYRLVDGGKPAEGTEKVQKKMLIRTERDINFDRRIDIVEYYKGEAGKEVKDREEFDLDLDGRVDATHYYKDGNIERIEEDLGFDGKVDTWKFYQQSQEDGKSVSRLIERRRDKDGDGKIDVWDYYVKGVLTKVGTDTNGDGTPDNFQRVDITK